MKIFKSLQENRKKLSALNNNFLSIYLNAFCYKTIHIEHSNLHQPLNLHPLFQFTNRIVGSDVVLQSFEIDKRSGQLSIRKGASLDVNHLNGESIVFSVEVNNKWLRDICLLNIPLFPTLRFKQG